MAGGSGPVTTMVGRLGEGRRRLGERAGKWQRVSVGESDSECGPAGPGGSLRAPLLAGGPGPGSGSAAGHGGERRAAPLAGGREGRWLARRRFRRTVGLSRCAEISKNIQDCNIDI